MSILPPSSCHQTLRAIDRLTDIGGLLGAISLLGILVLIFSQIVSRNIFSHSIHFSWDLAGYFMGTCFLLTCGSALKAGSHVRVTALLEALPGRCARLVELLSCALGLAICMFLTWALVEMAWLSGLRGSTAATSFRVPLVYPQVALATGAAILTLQCIAQFLRLLRGEPMATGSGLE
jgi:TRAP-type C4-dicarboxylate transport system permease small subunit